MDLPQGVSNLIMQLLAKDPTGRPTSAAEVALTLRSLERNLARQKEAGEATVAYLSWSGTTLAKLFPGWPGVITDLNVGVVALAVNAIVLAAVTFVTRKPRAAGSRG